MEWRGRIAADKVREVMGAPQVRIRTLLFPGVTGSHRASVAEWQVQLRLY